MAITSKNIHKIKHQRVRERIRSWLKCTDVSLRPSKRQNLLPEMSGTEGGGRPLEFSHLLLELLPVARSESSPGSPLFELLKGGGERRERGEKGKRENEDDGTGVEFTLPAGRACYWCDESPALFWKSGGGGMLAIYDPDEVKRAY